MNIVLFVFVCLVLSILFALVYNSVPTFGKDINNILHSNPSPRKNSIVFTVYSVNYTSPQNITNQSRLIVVKPFNWIFENRNKRTFYIYTNSMAGCDHNTQFIEYKFDNDTLTTVMTSCYTTTLDSALSYYEKNGTMTHNEVMPVEHQKRMNRIDTRNILIYLFNEGYIDHQ